MSLPFRPAVTMLPVMAALALAGCNKQEPTNSKTAAGTALLPRSVSDDMPPYDTVRSQNPHLAADEGVSARRSATTATDSEAAVDADANAAAAAAADVEAASAAGGVKPAGE